MMKKIFIAALASTILFTAHAQDIIESNNRFAFDIYKQLSKTDKNLIFSPASITSAMSMTYVGAKNNTFDEISNTFYFNKNISEFNKTYNKLVENYSDKKSTVKLFNANSLWIQKGLKLNTDFLENNKKFYSSSANFTDFISNPEKSRNTINEWVEENTNNKIKNLIKPSAINNATRLVLVNALYFKGAWLTKFKKEKNTNEEFQIKKKESIKTVFMNNSFSSWYYEDKYCEIIDIPYSNEQISLLVILPKTYRKLKKVEKKLTYDYYINYIEKRNKKKIQLSLPKYNIESEFDLNASLKQLGIKEAFSMSADFSGITENEKLYISKVVHKANIELDEEGTEAAAATAIFMRKTSINVDEVNFKANRPFIYMIRNQKTNTIYFIGKVLNPEQ
jgi:leukocyte elastase inhibitor